MHTAHQILKQYWGYSAFRPLQAQIIEAVLAHKDVLALLPTGGGKSLCFQVPALCQAGVCIVVTPLIALMKDQVAHLQKMGVAAKAIFSGMTLQEMDIALDSCIYGKVKFLYVSPERLHTELFQARVQKMNVCLLAVDEAHCISQWGYDFRPAYLKIQELRSLLPSLPTIALTATATKAVQVDIQEKLGFTNAIVFQQSFARKNLAYRASNIEDKAKSLLALCKQHPGTAIVYANTRKKTKIIAHMLKQQGLCADFYHAGLSTQERATKQDAWVHNKTNSIVATNAFGMGIHKPDVRLVVHYDLPASIEAYYQEVGRAGRDEKPATAIVLYDQHDIDLLRENIATQHPASHQLKKVYQHLANYYQVAIGSHQLATYDFDLEDFSNTYQLEKPATAIVLYDQHDIDLLRENIATQHPASHQLKKVYQHLANYYQVAIGSHQLATYDFDLEDFSNTYQLAPTDVYQALKKLEEQGLIQLSHSFFVPSQVCMAMPRQAVYRFQIMVNIMLVVQYDGSGWLFVSPSTAHFLIIRLYAGRQIVMYHQTYIGLMNAHTKCIGSYNTIGFVVYPSILLGSSFLGRQACMVKIGTQPLLF